MCYSIWEKTIFISIDCYFKTNSSSNWHFNRYWNNTSEHTSVESTHKVDWIIIGINQSYSIATLQRTCITTFTEVLG